jgi:hypothetical protein
MQSLNYAKELVRLTALKVRYNHKLGLLTKKKYGTQIPGGHLII